MKTFAIVFFVLLSVNSFSQEVVKSTKATWYGGPCCIYGKEWTTQIKVPKNATVKISKAYTKENGYATPSIYKDSDTTVILQGKYQFNNYTQEAENDHFILPEGQSKIDFDGHLYWEIKVDKEIHEIEIKEYETLFPVPYP